MSSARIAKQGAWLGVTLLVATGVLTVIALATPKTPVLPAEPFSQGGIPTGVMNSLVKPNSGSYKVSLSETKANVLHWVAKTKNVWINRSERETPTATWHKQKQELSASFFVIDARSRGDEDIYVAGLYESGDATIERWKLVHPPSISPLGAYIPLDRRPMPTVRRSVVFFGTSLGIIRSLEVDPQNRFVLALTQEPRRLYSISVPTSPPSFGLVQQLHDTTSLPQLSGIHTIVFAKHITEGRKYLLLQQTRWAGLDSAPSYTVFLNDANEDGVFDSPVVLDTLSWKALGYHDLASWSLYGSILQ